MSKTKSIEDVLQEEGMLVSTMSGFSMYPMLRDRRDTIVVHRAVGRLKKYDVPLYKVGDKYVLHRIIKVLPDSYVIRGDNCERNEYGIRDEDILGVLTGFFRGDKEVNMRGIKYRAYVNLYCRFYQVRQGWRWMKRQIKRLLNTMRSK